MKVINLIKILIIILFSMSCSSENFYTLNKKYIKPLNKSESILVIYNDKLDAGFNLTEFNINNTKYEEIKNTISKYIFNQIKNYKYKNSSQLRLIIRSYNDIDSLELKFISESIKNNKNRHVSLNYYLPNDLDNWLENKFSNFGTVLFIGNIKINKKEIKRKKYELLPNNLYDALIPNDMVLEMKLYYNIYDIAKKEFIQKGVSINNETINFSMSYDDIGKLTINSLDEIIHTSPLNPDF